MVRSKILRRLGFVEHYFFALSQIDSLKAQKLLTSAASCQQVHGKILKIARNNKYYKGCDGLISFKPNIISIRTADCLPVFIVSIKPKIIIAMHAGWRGLLKGIINTAFINLQKEGADINKVYAAIGPHIGKCCYQVGKDIVDKFIYKIDDNKIYSLKKNKYHLDLALIAKKQILKFGLPRGNFEDVSVCTCCNRNFASYRRDKTDKRNYSLIKIYEN